MFEEPLVARVADHEAVKGNIIQVPRFLGYPVYYLGVLLGYVYWLVAGVLEALLLLVGYYAFLLSLLNLLLYLAYLGYNEACLEALDAEPRYWLA